MKRHLILFLTVASALMIQTNAKAQSHDVSFNLAPVAVSNFGGAYFYNFDDRISFGGTVGYQNLKVTDVFDPSQSYTYGGFYFAPEARYFFDPSDENDGFFIGGYLKYRSMGTSGDVFAGFNSDGDVVQYDRRNTGISFGLTTGRTWVTDFGLFFSVWSGLGYYLFDNVSFTNDYEPTITIESNLPSLDFRFGVSVGFRFE